jgi:hypothetical protein
VSPLQRRPARPGLPDRYSDDTNHEASMSSNFHLVPLSCTARVQLRFYCCQETILLSPHEFATLMLVSSAPEQIDMNRAELDTLLERQLISLENLAEGLRRPALTPSGHSLLQVANTVQQKLPRLPEHLAEGCDEPV